MEQRLHELLENHSQWKREGNTLVGNWKFATFTELRVAVGQLCDLAGKFNHHPTVTYGYNALRVVTTTHDAGNTVTHKDVDLALRVSQLLEE